LRNHGMILAPDGAKMSKSKGNTIEPGGLIEQGYGADAVRIMELFIGPWNQAANWSVEGMGGAHRFLQRTWTLVQEFLAAGNTNTTATSEQEAAIYKPVHGAIKKVTGDVHDLSFNTAIAAQMECLNQLYLQKKVDHFEPRAAWQSGLSLITQLLAPFAPHIAEELWQQLGNDGSVHSATWPTYNERYLIQTTITVVVQVNGKVRAQLIVPANISEDDLTALATKDSHITPYLRDAKIKKTIFIAGKLVNFVVG
jgi:leucyl-tRNA synthetase